MKDIKKTCRRRSLWNKLFAEMGLLVLILCSPLVITTARAQIDARLLRYPDVSATTIAFVYAGDVWLVPKTGGVAQRLSTPKGEEEFPRFSPDGTLLAFSANYDGNLDIYVVPVAGGVPARLTFHPSPDRVLDWYPDGTSILFASSRESGKDRFNQLYKVSKIGGLPEKLPVPYGEFGSLTPGGRQLAYMPISRDFRTWKRYRGGMAPDIWLFDLKTYGARNLTASDANDAHPMWHGDTLYFLSDRDANKRNNIWACDPAAGALRQVTAFEDHDVRFPAIGPSDIVFENAGRLYRLELPSEKLAEVKVEVYTDRATLKPQAKNVSGLIQSAALSPSGKRAVLEARGELFSLPAEHGPVINMTRTPGTAERFPSWSPDGKSIAYMSDGSGEYEICVRPADGTGAEKTITRMGPGFRYRLFWSPDGKKIAFADQAMNINIADVATGQVTRIDKGLSMHEGDLRRFRCNWSPDSRWMAYSRAAGNSNEVVHLYDAKNGVLHRATSDFYSTSAPAFDPEGRYLFCLTSRTLEPSYSDIDNTWIYANTTNIAAVCLRKDVPSPLAPRNDMEALDKKEDAEKAAREEPGKAKAKKDGEAGKKEEPGPVEIDLDGFEERLVILPPKAGNYASLAAVKGKVLYIRQPRTGSGKEDNPIAFWDLEAREEKTVIPDADGYIVSADGGKMLAWKRNGYAVVEIKPDQKMEKTLATASLEATVDPAAEWRQIFNDAWRFERDYFYDPGMHGVDWPAMRERYGKLLEDAVTRWDVNFVIGEMIAELNSSHTYRSGGDEEAGERRDVGLLGCDFALENGAYRIARVLEGAPWDNEARSPLNQPGVKAKQGDYLLAVNRVPLDPGKDPWSALQGLAGTSVLLTVNDTPKMEGAREVLVETLRNEYRLRNLAWINEKRLRVEKASGGRIGYIYVPDTGRNGQTELQRQFAAQFEKEGLIIDERFNSGGQIPDRFVELLNRPIYGYYGVRDGRDWQWPPFAHAGPQGDADQRLVGLGRRLLPVLFQAGRRGSADRDADLGRPYRNVGESAAHRRRRSDRTHVRHLFP